jgi:sterol desaturase/sphingolipid hydroxylase (fatty acid hydroxylase superfamily)
MLAYLVTIAAACAFTEFVGYWLHILLHSHRIEFLSRNHMIHHLIVYGPNMPQRRSTQYLKSTYDRASVLGIGLEWLLPAGLILTAAFAAFRALGVPPAHQAVFVAVSLAWGFAMFSYMHDAMHLKDFWMEQNPRLREWFLNARRRHDVHHMDLDDAGFMPYNFGICFFVFDRLFGTLKNGHSKFNQAGLDASLKRYAFIRDGAP